jgi:aminomethyltransferase
MLGCGIGMGYVSPDSSVIGIPLEIRHEGISLEANVVDLPFYREGSLKK